jgi:hypothetical protein
MTPMEELVAECKRIVDRHPRIRRDLGADGAIKLAAMLTPEAILRFAGETRYPELSREQFEAIEAFARKWGRTWKMTLRKCWENGTIGVYVSLPHYAPILHQLRNHHGPAWLKKFRLSGD